MLGPEGVLAAMAQRNVDYIGSSVCSGSSCNGNVYIGYVLATTA